MKKPVAIINKLNDLAERVNDAFPDLNCGGCCVFASLVANELRSLGIEAYGIVASNRGYNSSIEQARSMVNDPGDMTQWNDNGVFFSHVGVGFELDGKKYQFESEEGVRPSSGRLWVYRSLYGELTCEELTALAARGEHWNKQFDRDLIPALQEHVHNAFKEDET